MRAADPPLWRAGSEEDGIDRYLNTQRTEGATAQRRDFPLRQWSKRRD
jgi:hypothetical protein